MPTSKTFALAIDDRHPPPAVPTNKPGPLAAIVAVGPIEIDFLGQLLPPPLILNSHPISGFYSVLFVQHPHIKMVVSFYCAFLFPPFPASRTAHDIFP